MSMYAGQVNRERQAPPAVAASVATSIDYNQVYNSEHPLYKEYTRRLDQNLAAVIARESAKKRDAQQAVCPYAVPGERREMLIADYPEFRIVWSQMSVPVHALWMAGRALVNQYMTHHLGRYAQSYVHYGGSALAYMTMGVSDVHLRVVSSSALAVHESFSDDVACARLMSGAAAASVVGWTVDLDMMTRYRDGEYMRKKTVMQSGDVAADALVVDGSLHAMSPLQFCAAMLQHKASVGMFALPYHPSMLMQSSGGFPHTGVSYSVNEHEVKLLYPEGVAGVTRYLAAVWHSWLVNTVRQVAGFTQCAFQFELMGLRSNFMVIQVVRVDEPLELDTTFVHSLQTDHMGDYTMVHAWRLRELTSRVDDPASWERVAVTVPTRVVERTHDYAMALPADQFSRHAIRKRLAVVNDRVVVHGTSVQVSEPMNSHQLDVLEIALFTHCFVARYEAGRLSSALKRVVDEVAGFGAMTFLDRLACVVSTTFSLLYDWSIGQVDDILRSAFDAARKWLGRLRVDQGPVFQPVPRFIRYETIVRVAVKPVLSAVRRNLGNRVWADQLEPDLPGFAYANVSGSVGNLPSVEVPLVSDTFQCVGDSATVFSDIVDVSTGAGFTEDGDCLWTQIRANNEVDQAGPERHFMEENTVEAEVGVESVAFEHYRFDPGYIHTLDDFHEAIVPGIREVDFTYDPSSISVDDQDRSMAAEYLKLPLHNDEPPKAVDVYKSKLHAYNVLKRPMTTQETLSAFHARNFSAPVLALPQNERSLILEVWDDFLNIACVSDARTKLAKYQTDPVSLEERAFAGWTDKARPENVRKVLKHLLDNPQAWEEYRIDRYESMLKSDVKPPLSDKPLHSRVEPQVIVHHLPEINAVFSSVMRVLVRRFLSLLKPNFMLNLLKDMPQVRDVIQNFHVWRGDVTYLENDFSKYDKSQGAFVHALETFVFEQLGMGPEMLEQWGLGHVDCSVRSVSTGLSLQVRYQRKSGDATTAFGNGILNMLSVLHAYKGTDIVWAVFMGDDSLVEARFVVSGDLAVRTLAEKFNLQAKFFVTTAPYFASHFILINDDLHRVTCVPDPLKRVEKWSMAVVAANPKWEERYESAVNSLSVYRNRANLVGLGRALYERYSAVDGIDLGAVGDAVASAIRSFENFRAMWEERSSHIVF